MTKVKGRPFVLKEVIITEHKVPQLGNMGKWARSKFIASDWRETDTNAGGKVIDYQQEFGERFI